MLSSTSLLHGNCIFNRNNTVATQQGMKTYWLCKSYRITMCRARCITHQGRVISATGVHNHQPHMKGPHYPSDFPMPTSSGSGSNGNSANHPSMRLPLPPPPPISTGQSSAIQHGINHLAPPQHQLIQQTDSHQSLHHSPSQSHHGHQEHHGPSANAQSQSTSNNSVSLQNMMQSVLNPNNVLHQSHISQILNPIHHQHHPHVQLLNRVDAHGPQGGSHGVHGPHDSHSSHGSHGHVSHPSPHMNSSHHPPSSLQITPIISSNQDLHSPDSSPRSSSHGHHLHTHHGHLHQNQIHQQQQDSPSLQHHHQSLTATTAANSVVVTSSSIAPLNASNAGNAGSSPISPPAQTTQQQQQQQQHCDSENEGHSITSESNIMSTISMAQPSFKMEQI